MLHLLLLRHAKSSWENGSLGDHERPLNKRGAKAAPVMGRYIRDHAPRPDRVLCSDAVRTRATLALVLPELGDPVPDVIDDPRLYLASAGDIHERINAQSDGARALMVIGHNPGLHGLALGLASRGERSQLQELSMKFPTAALAVFSFDTETWENVGAGNGSLIDFVVPRALIGSSD